MERTERRKLALTNSYTTGNFIRKLSDFRKKANLTRAEVADRLGKTEEYIEELEAYYSNPTLSEIRGYALAVGAALSLDLKLHLG